MKTSKTAALFDLDGVLIDTEPVYTEIWTNIERSFPTGIENFAHKIKGTTLPNILATYFPDAERQSRVVEMLKKEEGEMRFELFDDVIEFLEYLKRENIPAAIVTSSGDEKMERLFAMIPGFKDYFKVVVTDSWVTAGKPAPDCYLAAAKALDVDPADCWVFEDSFNGLKSGRAAGAHVVAITSTNPRESLAPLADIVVDHLSEFRF